MIIVSGEFEYKPEGLDTVKAAMVEVMAETRQEAGCIVYQFTQDFENPVLFRVYEEWESKDHLKAHGGAPHMGVFRGKIADHLVTRTVKMIEAGAVKEL